MPLCAARSTIFRIMDDEDDFRLSVVDVYDIAADIGKEFEKIIDQYGPDVLTSLMPRVITALEQLERVAEKQETSGAVIEELRSTISVLEHQKLGQAEHRQRYARDLEDIERDMREEKQELSARVSELLDENRKLSSCIARTSDDNTPSLTDDENSLEAEVSRGAVTRLQDALEGQREQLHRAQLQLQHHIMENHQVTSQMERLTLANKDLRRRGRQTAQQIRQLVEERAELHVNLQEQQRTLTQQQQRLGLAAKECWDLATAPAPSEPSDLSTKLVYERDDPHRPRFTLTELKDILYQRNELKARLSDLEDELSLYKPAEATSGSDSKKQYVMHGEGSRRRSKKPLGGRLLRQSGAGGCLYAGVCCSRSRARVVNGTHANHLSGGDGFCSRSSAVSRLGVGEYSKRRLSFSDGGGDRVDNCDDGQTGSFGDVGPSGTESIPDYHDDQRTCGRFECSVGSGHNRNKSNDGNGASTTSCCGSFSRDAKRLSVVRRLFPLQYVIVTDKNMNDRIKNKDCVVSDTPGSANVTTSSGDVTSSTDDPGVVANDTAVDNCGAESDKKDGAFSDRMGEAVEFVCAEVHCDISDSDLVVCNNNRAHVIEGRTGQRCFSPSLNNDLSNNGTLTNNESPIDTAKSTLSTGNNINSTILTGITNNPQNEAVSISNTNITTINESSSFPSSTIIRFPLGKRNPEYKRGNLLNLVLDSRESIAAATDEKSSGLNDLSRSSSFGRGCVGGLVPVDATWEDYCCRAIHSGMCGACGAWDLGDQQTMVLESGGVKKSDVTEVGWSGPSSSKPTGTIGSNQSGVSCDHGCGESSSGDVLDQLEVVASLKSSDERVPLSAVSTVQCAKCGVAGVLVPVEQVDWSSRLGTNTCSDPPPSCFESCSNNNASCKVRRDSAVANTKSDESLKPVLRYKASLPLCNLLDRMTVNGSPKEVAASSSVESRILTDNDEYHLDQTKGSLVGGGSAAECEVGRDSDSDDEDVKTCIKTEGESSSCDYFSRLYARRDSKTEAQDCDWDNIDRLTRNFHLQEHRNVESISEADIDGYLRSVGRCELGRMSTMDDFGSESRWLKELKAHHGGNSYEDLGSVDCCSKFMGYDNEDEFGSRRETNHSTCFSFFDGFSPTPFPTPLPSSSSSVAASNDLTRCSRCIPKLEVDHSMSFCTRSTRNKLDRSLSNKKCCCSNARCSCMSAHESSSVLSNNIPGIASSVAASTTNSTCSDLLNLSLTGGSDSSSTSTNPGASSFLCVDCVNLADVACKQCEVAADYSATFCRQQEHHRDVNQLNDNCQDYHNHPSSGFYHHEHNSCCCCNCPSHENNSGSSSLTSVDSAIEMRDNGSPFAAANHTVPLGGGSNEEGERSLTSSTSTTGTTPTSTNNSEAIQGDDDNGILDCLERLGTFLGVLDNRTQLQVFTRFDSRRELSRLLQRLFGALFIQGDGQRRGGGEVICDLSVLVVLVQAWVAIATGLMEFLLLGVTE